MKFQPIAEDLIFERAKVFPNPNTGMFTLSFELKQMGPTQINIFNSSGQLVFTRQLKFFKRMFTDNLDLMDAGPGTYFIVISQHSKSVYRKIIIARN